MSTVFGDPPPKKATDTETGTLTPCNENQNLKKTAVEATGGRLFPPQPFRAPRRAGSELHQQTRRIGSDAAVPTRGITRNYMVQADSSVKGDHWERFQGLRPVFQKMIGATSQKERR